MDGKSLRFIDKIIGGVLYGSFAIASKIKKRKCTENNIIAIKLWALGESVLILPALKALKDSSKGKLYVLCTKQNKHIFEGIDFIDEVIVMEIKPGKIFKTASEIRKKGIGACVDFEPYTKFSAVMAYLSKAKIRIGFDNRPKLYTHPVEVEEDRHAVKNFINLVNVIHKTKYPEKLIPLNFSKMNESKTRLELEKHGIKKSDKLIGIHAGSAGSSLSRRWSEENFAKLADMLIEKYKVKIVLVGSGNEEEMNNRILSFMKNKAINLADELDLKEFFALTKRLKMFIANDSGPMHIAASMGVPTIGLFGPNLPQRYGPYGKRNIGLYKGNGMPAVKPFQGIFGENNEIEKIKVSDVLEAVKNIKAL